jgi:repressor LexA
VKELTDKQESVLDFIRWHYREFGYAPSFREISIEFDLTLKTIQDHIEALQKKGVIKKTSGVARSIVIIDQDSV